MGVIRTKMEIIFPIEWDELESFEIAEKGWLQGVKVVLDSGESHELIFYDQARLNQELEDEFQKDRVCFVEKNLIILTKVTQSNIIKAVEQAKINGYFEKDV